MTQHGKHVLYSAMAAPNPRRVLLAAAELGLEQTFEVKNIDLATVKSKEIITMNPEGQVPVLKTAEGLCVSESVAITRFLEEKHSDGSRPSLFGGPDPMQRALVEQWNRRIDIQLFMGGVGRVWIHNPILSGFVMDKTGLKQSQAERDFGQKICDGQFKILDAQLKDNSFVAGDRISVADITLLCCLDFALGLAGVTMRADTLPNLQAWRQRMAERPSAKRHPNPHLGVKLPGSKL